MDPEIERRVNQRIRVACQISLEGPVMEGIHDPPPVNVQEPPPIPQAQNFQHNHRGPTLRELAAPTFQQQPLCIVNPELEVHLN